MASYKNYIGIDMAKDSFVVNVYEQKECQKFDNTFEGFLKFKEFYKDILECSLAVVESTGGYERKFVLFMIENNFKIHRVNSFKARQFLNSLHSKIKTDNFDAQGLARYAKERYLDLKIYNIFDEKNEEFRQLMTRREELLDLKTIESNRSKAPCRDYIEEFSILELIQKNIDDTPKKIKSFIKNDEDMQKKQKILKSVDGIGEITSWNLMAFFQGTLESVRDVKRHPLQACTHAKEIVENIAATVQSEDVDDIL